jgi:hypothetical protein
VLSVPSCVVDTRGRDSMCVFRTGRVRLDQMGRGRPGSPKFEEQSLSVCAVSLGGESEHVVGAPVNSHCPPQRAVDHAAGAGTRTDGGELNHLGRAVPKCEGSFGPAHLAVCCTIKGFAISAKAQLTGTLRWHESWRQSMVPKNRFCGCLCHPHPAVAPTATARREVPRTESCSSAADYYGRIAARMSGCSSASMNA